MRKYIKVNLKATVLCGQQAGIPGAFKMSPAA
jgi:hypothetical protein